MTAPVVAVAQAPSIPGDVNTNVEQAVALIADAAAAGASFVVLPELFLSGYDIDGIATAPSRHVVAVGDRHCKRLQDTCAEHGIAAIIGGAIAVEKGIANAALVIARDGAPVHVYRKVHLWGEEARVFAAGSQPAVVDFDGCRIGMAICFDAGFPEHMRALALAGATVIVCPAAFATGDQRNRYELYYPSRALENTLYVAVANAVGQQGGLDMFGSSRLCGPRGNEICRVQSDIGIVVTPIDHDELERAREDLPYLRCLPERPIKPFEIGDNL